MENQGHFRYNGQLKGHGGWVTSIAAPIDTTGSLISGSRDCSVIQWEIAPDSSTGVYGYAKRRMDGHSNFVQDVQISSDGQFGLSGAWDNSLRLWDLSNGASTCRFMGHSKDVMSVAFSPDNRQIISGSRDNTMKMWNTLGENKFTIDSEGHKDWVSCTRFSPNPQTPLIVSCGWDKMVKVWSLNNLGLQSNLAGHTGYWLCAATGSAIKIWDLESKQTVAELVPELPEMGKRAMKPECISLAWSADGSTLYSGYTDNTIRVWGVHA